MAVLYSSKEGNIFYSSQYSSTGGKKNCSSLILTWFISNHISYNLFKTIQSIYITIFIEVLKEKNLIINLTLKIRLNKCKGQKLPVYQL